MLVVEECSMCKRFKAEHESGLKKDEACRDKDYFQSKSRSKEDVRLNYIIVIACKLLAIDQSRGYKRIKEQWMRASKRAMCEGFESGYASESK